MAHVSVASRWRGCQVGGRLGRGTCRLLADLEGDDCRSERSHARSKDPHAHRERPHARSDRPVARSEHGHARSHRAHARDEHPDAPSERRAVWDVRIWPNWPWRCGTRGSFGNRAVRFRGPCENRGHLFRTADARGRTPHIHSMGRNVGITRFVGVFAIGDKIRARASAVTDCRRFWLASGRRPDVPAVCSVNGPDSSPQIGRAHV